MYSIYFKTLCFDFILPYIKTHHGSLQVLLCGKNEQRQRMGLNLALGLTSRTFGRDLVAHIVSPNPRFIQSLALSIFSAKESAVHIMEL